MRPHVGTSVVTTRRRPWRGALVVEGGDPDPQAGKKGEMLHGDSIPMSVWACLARLTNLIRIVRFSRLLRLLNPFAT